MALRNLAIGVAFLTAALCVPPCSAQEDSIEWFNNYHQALAAAKKTGKPIFLEYRCEP